MKNDFAIRFVAWIIRVVGKRTLASWVLLLIALGSTTYGLARNIRGLELRLLAPVSLFGLLFGWLLARSRLSGWLAIPTGVLLVSGTILGKLGNLGDELLKVFQAMGYLALDSLRWFPGSQNLDLSGLLLSLSNLLTRASVLILRMWDWLQSLRNNGGVFDPVAVVMVWSLAIALASGWAAWEIRRHDQPLWGLIPATALLATSLAYGQEKPGLLLPVLGVAFLLLASNSYAVRERRWERNGIDFSEEVRTDLGIAAVLVTVALTFLAGISPYISIDKIVDYANRLSQPRSSGSKPIGESLGLKPPPAAPTGDSLSGLKVGGLPRSHLLGSGPELSQQVVMMVHTGDFPPGPPERFSDLSPPLYYWRSLTYDRYNGHGWITSQTLTISYSKGETTIDLSQVSNKTSSYQHLMEIQVEMVGKGHLPADLVYAPGELIAVDQGYQAAWRTIPSPDRPGIFDLFGTTTHSINYYAKSLAIKAPAWILRASGINYPGWIQNRYLALPKEIPSRVLDLARELTATEPTPFDRARAIEAYLRTYPYNLNISLPPRNRDVVDYFLFDEKQGFCDYYATAMVVLARAAGLPARLAVGYTSGSYDTSNAEYVVTEADAHSWPEIYFAGVGWVGFEPTSSRPEVYYEDTSTPPPKKISDLEANPIQIPLPDWFLYLEIGGVLLLFLVIGTLAWLITEQWLLLRLSPDTAAIILFQRLLRTGRWLTPVGVGVTPYEFKASLAKRLAILAQGKVWGKYLSSATQEAGRLTEFYTHAVYSRRLPQVSEQHEAILAWKRLRLRLFLARLKPRLSRRNT